MSVFAKLDVLLNSLQGHLFQTGKPLPEQLQLATQLLTEAEVLTQQLSSDLLAEVSVIRQPEALLIFIQNEQACCTAICNKVYDQRIQMEQCGFNEYKPFILRYKSLLQLTDEFLQFIELHFSCYFNAEQKAPFYFLARYREQLEKRYQSLKPLLEKKFGQQLLCDYCMEYIRVFAENPTTGSSNYYIISYLDKLTISLKACTELLPKGNYSGLECCILLMNFNHEQVLYYFIDKLEQNAPAEENILLQEQYWYGQQKLLVQLHNMPGTGLYPNKQSLVQVLMHLAENELYQLQLKEDRKQPSVNNEHKTAKALRFNLPVSQIAILLRLMVEAGLIKVPNQTAFLKEMAVWIQTERAGNVSADSLRNKYYTPERNSIEAVKDVLFGMIKNSRNLQA